MKSKNRVSKGYKEGSRDWKDQFDMLLDDGITCSDCVYCRRCCGMYGQKDTDTSCQFLPNRFMPVEQTER